MRNVGFTPLDVRGQWMGGRYYLQHLVRCIRSLPEERRLNVYDLYWDHPAEIDPFAEVREQMSGTRVLRFPANTTGRVWRKVSRLARGISDARDLFEGIDATFPIPLIENQGIPSIFWLPDFQHEHMRAMYTPEHYARIVDLYTRYVEGAAHIVVSSEFGFRDLERFYPARAADATVLRFCSVPDDEWFALDPREYVRSIGLDGPFFIVSNQLTEQKNHMALVEAARILRDRGVDVVVACTGSDYDFRGMNWAERVKERVAEYGLQQQVRFLGLLPRSAQMAVTRAAVGALQPSRFEGWSTIIEDAKSLGKYVIASEFPVHREQLAGLPATFVDPDDVEGWADAMAAVARSKSVGPDPEEERNGRERLTVAMRECGETFASIFARATAS
jgi:glycosyltransferase involved in cell wall biosynthesis